MYVKFAFLAFAIIGYSQANGAPSQDPFPTNQGQDQLSILSEMGQLYNLWNFFNSFNPSGALSKTGNEAKIPDLNSLRNLLPFLMSSQFQQISSPFLKPMADSVGKLPFPGGSPA